MVTRVVVVVAVFAAGACVGRFVHPGVVTITKVETKTVDHVVYQDRIVQVKGETVYKDRVITKYVYAPDGGVSEKTVEEDKTSDATKTDTTTVAKGTEDKNTDTKSETITKPADIPRFSADVGVGLQPLRPAGAVVLIGFGVRPFQALPFTVGAWGTLPTLDLQGTAVGLKAGVTW